MGWEGNRPEGDQGGIAYNRPRLKKHKEKADGRSDRILTKVGGEEKVPGSW